MEHTCPTNYTIGWDKSKIITTNWHYHQYLCLEAWHINSTHPPLNCDHGSLLPDAYLISLGKRQLNSDCVKGPLVVVFRSPLMKALDRSVKMLDLWIVTYLVTFTKSVNQSSIKPCLTEGFVSNYKPKETLQTKIILKAAVSLKVMYESKTIESVLARWRKGWILARKFKNKCLSKVDTQDTILYCLCRLLLKVFSIMQFWVVAIIKSLSVTFWKLSSKLQQ